MLKYKKRSTYYDPKPPTHVKINVYHAQESKCFYCTKKMICPRPGDPKEQQEVPRYATWDHLQPKSRGGGNRLTNLVICCYECNQEKNNMTLKEYRKFKKEKANVQNNSKATRSLRRAGALNYARNNIVFPALNGNKKFLRNTTSCNFYIRSVFPRKVQVKIIMLPLFNVNGLMFWTEREILLREHFRDYLVAEISRELRSINPGFHIVGIEAPLLTPHHLINPNYTSDDIYLIPPANEFDAKLVLRPETTPGSFLYARYLLDNQLAKPPLCVWQAGKSFRREQDQPTKHMRLKEFYQLEIQCIYTDDTLNDYHGVLQEPVKKALADLVGLPSRIVTSDRLPSYSEITVDVEVDNKDRWMELASISRRTDFPGVAKFQTKKGVVEKKLLVAEIAIGLDRCLYNFNCRTT